MMPQAVTHELQKLDEMEHRRARNNVAPLMVGDRFDQQVEPAPKLFTCRPWGEVMEEASRRPVPKKFAGDVWGEGELAILFAETGCGKTALAVQFGNDIASGESTTGLAVETETQLVAYDDQELTDTQQVRRYADEYRNGDGQKHLTNLFQFHPNFMRVEMNPAVHVFERIADWEGYFQRELDRVVLESKAKVIIIDNISALSHESEKQKFALPLMTRLNEWKKERGLSILVLAHTPKRDETRPLSLNDLAGSRILANFADSIFALGKSAVDTKIRYLKQFKVRSGELVYSAENVGVFRFEKTDNHLGFSLIGHSKESAHLVHQTDEAKEKLIADVQSMSAAGKSQREIASELQISLGMVNRHLKTAKASTNGRSQIVFNDPVKQSQWEKKCSWE